MYEFKILRDTDAVVQKTMNQWKHQFTLRVQSMHPCPHDPNKVVVLLTRTDK